VVEQWRIWRFNIFTTWSLVQIQSELLKFKNMQRKSALIYIDLVKVTSKKQVLNAKRMFTKHKNEHFYIEHQNFKEILKDPRWGTKEFMKHHNFHVEI
jgi:hypothetical protein